MLNPLTDPVTIERLREVLAAVGLPVNARELTEILWLACQLTAEPATADGAPADGHPSDQQPGQSGMQEGPAEGASPSLTDVGAARTSVTSDAFASQGLYAEARTDGRSFDTRTVRVPTAPMLHNTLTIQRALRPLKRKVASRRADTLDEDATARRIAEQPPRERRWVPVMQASPERWLNLALVVDTGPSMWIWRPLARELQEALTRLGAFRDLRIWYLTGGRVSTTPGGPPLNAAALLEPSGRQASLVLSDCSGAHWWNNSAPRALHLWGQHGPVGILQPLAERLWRRTAAPPIPGMAQARRRAAPNTEVLFTPHDASPGHGMPVPVMEISPDWLGDWARLIASSSSPALPMAAAYVQDMPMTRAEPLRRELDLPISERVQRFQASASPEAVRLAAYVAVSVPTLPIMQLIHHQMLRNPRPSNIAEVLLSGLLRSIEDWPGAYEFVPGARQALLATLPRSESWYAADVLSRMSSEIANRIDGAGESFRAYLRIPEGTGERSMVSNQPFAMVSREALLFLRRDTSGQISLPMQPPFPLAREADSPGQAAQAQRLFDLLSEEERAAFNRLSDEGQPARLHALSLLRSALDSMTSDPTTRERIESALSTFAREIAKSDSNPNFTGAVIEVCSLVEVLAKRFLSRLAYSVYGDDTRKVQYELKLPTRKLASLSLGKTVQALRIAASLPEFADVLDHLPGDWIDRLEIFSSVRNDWAHGAIQHADYVDRAFWAMREGILIAGWLTDRIALIHDSQASLEEIDETPGLNSPPSQLPADITTFTGRAEETEALCRLLVGEANDVTHKLPVVALVGLGGVGKTALAVHVAHILSSQFPDGHLYANLRSNSQPIDPADLIARFLRDLGIDPGQIPVDAEARTAVYRALLAGRRILVVLDDVSDTAQARPLLPGTASCGVLITSRRRLHDLEGITILDLDVLPPDCASQLFAHIAGEERVRAEPDAAQEVVAACGGLPLAIRIAGAQLASHRSWSVRNLAEHLADQRNRLDTLQAGNLAVRTAFGASYSNLRRRRNGEKEGIDASQLFRFLSLWTGPSISLPAASALMGKPEASVLSALQTLADEHLLESPASGRYCFHDLIRIYAAERTHIEETMESQETAITRLLNWYLHTTEAAAQVISPQNTRVPLSSRLGGVRPLDFRSIEEAIAWCEAERACLVAATSLANNSALHELAWKVPAAAMSFFYRRGYWSDWVATHEIGLGSARAIEDRHAEAWMLNNLGIVSGIRHMEESIDYLQQAMAICAEIDDRRGEARTANNVATACLNLRRFDAALEVAQRSLQIQRKAGLRHGEGIALRNLGNCYRHSGSYDQALGLLQQSLVILRELGDRDAEADTLADLGDTYLGLDQGSKSREFLRQSLAITRAIGNRYGEARTLRRLGHAEIQAGNARQAHQLLSEATSLFEELGDRAQAAETQAAAARIAPTEADPGGIGVLTHTPPSQLTQQEEGNDVSRSVLGRLSLLGEGGFGRVFRIEEFRLPGDTTPFAYKEYTTEIAAQARSASAAVQFRQALSLAEQAEMDLFSVWPRALVIDGAGKICGCLMPLIPSEFFAQMTDPDTGHRASRPCEMQWLAASGSQRQTAGIVLPEISRRDRLALLAQMAYAIGWLHKRGWVYGGMNFKDVVFALDPPRIVLLDCDSAAALADRSRKQPLAPFWDPPELARQPSTDAPQQELQDEVTDIYQLGLAILRCLTPGSGVATTRDVSRLDGVLDAEGIRLVARALSTDRASRPTAGELVRYLNRLLSDSSLMRAKKGPIAAEGQIVMPFYLICDVSYSMYNDMLALNDNIKRLRRAIIAEPVVDDIVQFCVMTFSDSARVVMPMDQMSEGEIPALSVEGGTNYGAAFRLLAQTIMADSAGFRAQGYRVYRPCAFFFTDGEPLDNDWHQTFTETLTYDRASGHGMKACPVFVPFGLRDASDNVLKQLAYPPERSKWYKARNATIEQVLRDIVGIIMATVITSGTSGSAGQPALSLQPPPQGSGIVLGDSEYSPDWM